MRYIPNDVDVLLTHAGSGSPFLRAAVERIQPMLHAYGHEHDQHGAFVEWPSRRAGAEARVCVNAAICDKQYSPRQLPVVVDLLPR